MSYAEDWLALAARIRSLSVAGSIHAQFQASNTSDSWGIGAELIHQCQSIIVALEQFQGVHAASLPTAAKDALVRFLTSQPAQAIKNERDKSRVPRTGLVVLPAFESEMSYLLAAQQERIKIRSNRALQHLQRLLAVDVDVRKKWQGAFAANRGEEDCEKLGGLHRLWHGIYAFKVHAAGGRTDLVFNEPIDLDEVTRSGEGLVLTEWKIATPSNVGAQFTAARAQAGNYSAGALAGVELRNYRYIIAVSEQQLPATIIPADANEGGVTYRHVNIAIVPRMPSAQGKAAAKGRNRNSTP